MVESPTIAPLISHLARTSHDPAVLLWIADVASQNVASSAVERLPAPTLVEHATALALRFDLVLVVIRRHDEFSEDQAQKFGRIAHAGWCAARSQHDLEPLQRLLSARSGKSAFQACVNAYRDWIHLSDAAMLLVARHASYHAIASILQERHASQIPDEIRITLARRLTDSANAPSPYAIGILAVVMNTPPEPFVAALVQRSAPKAARSIVEAWAERARPDALHPNEQKLALLHQAAVHSWLLHAASEPSLHSDVLRALNERTASVDSHFLVRLVRDTLHGPSPLRLELLTRLGTHALGVLGTLSDATPDEAAAALLLAQEARFHVVPRREIEERWRALPLDVRVRAARRFIPIARKSTPTRPRNAPPTANLVLQDSEVFQNLSPAEIGYLGGSMANVAEAALVLSAEELKVFVSVLEANFNTPLCDLFLAARRSAR